MKKKGLFHFFIFSPSGKAFFGTSIHVRLSANCHFFLEGGGEALRKHLFPFLPSFRFVYLRVSMRVLPHTLEIDHQIKGKARRCRNAKGALKRAKHLSRLAYLLKALCALYTNTACADGCVMAGGVNASQLATDFICFVFC